MAPTNTTRSVSIHHPRSLLFSLNLLKTLEENMQDTVSLNLLRAQEEKPPDTPKPYTLNPKPSWSLRGDAGTGECGLAFENDRLLPAISAPIYKHLYIYVCVCVCVCIYVYVCVSVCLSVHRTSRYLPVGVSGNVDRAFSLDSNSQKSVPWSFYIESHYTDF